MVRNKIQHNIQIYLYSLHALYNGVQNLKSGSRKKLLLLKLLYLNIALSFYVIRKFIKTERNKM